MDKFGFLFHPYDVDILFQRGIKEYTVQNKSKRVIERSLRWLPPVKRESAVVTSKTGNTVIGEMIMVPLICDQILGLDQQFILNKTIRAAQLAEELGVKIVGLGAYLSPVGRRGALIAKEISIPVTSGTTYTIATAIDATIKAAEDTELDIAQAHIVVIGGTGAIGRVCAQAISEKAGKITLVARNVERLESVRSLIRANPHCTAEVVCDNDILHAVKDADIVVISTNNPAELLKANDLQPGCIVCDMSVPHNISPDEALSAEILIVDGGIVQCPGHVDFDYLALPPGVAYACLSEVMILALEGKFESFSHGGEISYQKILEIKSLAQKHGFSLSNFKSFGKAIPPEAIEHIKHARGKRKAMRS